MKLARVPTGSTVCGRVSGECFVSAQARSVRFASFFFLQGTVYSSRSTYRSRALKSSRSRVSYRERQRDLRKRERERESEREEETPRLSIAIECKAHHFLE